MKDRIELSKEEWNERVNGGTKETALKASELRIGNLVGSYNKGEDDRILSIAPENIMVEFKANKQVYTMYRPIPLTEEWLLKFGFNRSDWWYILKSMSFNFSSLNLNFKTWGITISDGQEEVLVKTDCIYVHQLQNLYFALTGEELTIKEDEKV